MEVVELGDRHDVAGDRRGDLFLLLSLEYVDVTGLPGLPAPEVDERRVGSDPPAQDSQIAELAHELIVHRLEDLSHQGAFLDRQDLFFRRAGLGRSRAESVDVIGAESTVGDQVEQLAQAQVLAGADTEHRDELPLGDRVVSRLAQLVGLDGLSLEVAHHEVFVELDDLLDDHAIRLGRRQGTIGGVFIVRLDHIDDARKARALTDRHIERHALRPERLADRLEVRAVVDVLGVHLGDHDKSPEPQPPRFVEQPARVDLDPRRSRHGDDHVLDGRQSTQGIADEVGVTGCVNQVNLLPDPGQVTEMAIDREVPAFLLLVDVEGTGPVIYRSLAVGRTGGKEQGVGKTGLARRPMSSEGDVADIGDMVGRGHWRRLP